MALFMLMEIIVMLVMSNEKIMDMPRVVVLACELCRNAMKIGLFQVLGLTFVTIKALVMGEP